MNGHEYYMNGSLATNAANTVNIVRDCPSNACYEENEEKFTGDENRTLNDTSRAFHANLVFKTNGAVDSFNGASHSQPNKESVTKSNDSFSTAPKLNKITDVPKYLQFNPYVFTGYRTPGLTYWQCIHSLCYVHNETVNILTHGIPFICFLLLTPPNIPWDQINYPILACFHIMGSVAPWLGSTVYHLFMNHEKGESFYRELLKWDVIGIWITQSFGASTTVYTSVALYPNTFRYTFVLLYIILSIRALKDSAMTDCVWRRRLGFTFLVLMRFIAFYCRFSTFADGEGSCFCRVVIDTQTLCDQCQGYSHCRHCCLSQKWIHLAMQEILPIVGAFISASRIPERWFPGRFDYVFNSHNIMHVFVVLGAVHMHHATCSDLLWLSKKDGNNEHQMLPNN